MRRQGRTDAPPDAALDRMLKGLTPRRLSRGDRWIDLIEKGNYKKRIPLGEFNALEAACAEIRRRCEIGDPAMTPKIVAEAKRIVDLIDRCPYKVRYAHELRGFI